MQINLFSSLLPSCPFSSSLSLFLTEALTPSLLFCSAPSFSAPFLPLHFLFYQFFYVYLILTDGEEERHSCCWLTCFGHPTSLQLNKINLFFFLVTTKQGWKTSQSQCPAAAGELTLIHPPHVLPLVFISLSLSLLQHTLRIMLLLWLSWWVGQILVFSFCPCWL